MLPDPAALLAEAARVLRPGGRAIFSHPDFDRIVLNAPHVELSGRVCHAHADAKQDCMARVEGQMGRKGGLEDWRQGLVRAEDLGEFFYAETTFMAMTRR